MNVRFGSLAVILARKIQSVTSSLMCLLFAHPWAHHPWWSMRT